MPFILRLWTDPDTMRPVGGPVRLTEAEARRWFAAMIDPGNPTDGYRLIVAEDRRPVGEISFHRLVETTMTADFNIKIVGSERRKGYAKQAMLLFLDYFFNQFGGRVLIDDVASGNLEGRLALQRFGFELDATPDDVFRLRMTRAQFNSRYSSIVRSLVKNQET